MAEVFVADGKLMVSVVSEAICVDMCRERDGDVSGTLARLAKTIVKKDISVKVINNQSIDR